MPVIAEQVQRDITLVSPLPNDAAITLQWSVHDEHSRAIASQTCTLTYTAGGTLTANVPPADRNYTFRLAKGTQVTLPLSAQVNVNLAALGANPAPQAETLHSGPIQITFTSKSDADDDTSKTVYSEMSQELRRTRTLYETFLVIVTGALATVFSKRADIAGAYRPSFAYGLGFLALIVIYMIWQIADRYRKTTAAIYNLERSWGLRATHAPAFPLDSDSSWRLWWVDHAWRHTVWAAGLTLYALMAIGIVINFLHAPAEPVKVAATPVNISCSQPAGQDDQGTVSKKGSAKSPRKTDK